MATEAKDDRYYDNGDPRQCPDCGIQLRLDGSVDALPEDDEPAEHYLGCRQS